MAKEVWLRASGPPARLEFPGGEKFLLTGEPVKFSGDLAVFAARAVKRCHGVEVCDAPIAAPAPAPPAPPKKKSTTDAGADGDKPSKNAPGKE